MADIIGQGKGAAAAAGAAAGQAASAATKAAGAAGVAAGAGGGLLSQGKSALQSATSFVSNAVTSGIKAVGDFIFSTNQQYVEDKLFIIGRPYAFNQNIDPFKRLSSYIRTKMSVIDLVPCYYEMNFTKMEESIKNDEPFKGGMYKIEHSEKIKEFRSLCKHHGLDEYSGIRLYTTDETVAVDGFNVEYKESFFQEPANRLSNLTRQLQDVTRSVTGTLKPFESAIGATQKLVGAGAEAAKVDTIVSNNINKIIASIGDVILKGNRLTFPKIWQNTTHSSSLSAVIKLVSPYGSPKAIKQFIIKPLMYLVLLASPQTNDGISYGNTIPLTIKAYGMNYFVLGAINSITLRRGGADTSFNIYRQPLVIDVSIDFQTLFDAFAVFTLSKNKDKQNADWDLWNKDVFFDPGKAKDAGDSESINPNLPKTPLSSMSTMLESLRPVKLTEGDFQVYGNFLKPTRAKIPGSKTNTGANLVAGLAITAAASLGNMDTLSSTLATAKSSVAGISKKVSSWVSPPAEKSAAVRNTVKSNSLGVK